MGYTDGMNFCAQCKHSRPDPGGDPYSMTCMAPQNSVAHVSVEKYLVSGIEQPVIMASRGMTCTALRLKRDPESEALACGPDGKWWEAKEVA